MTLNEYLYKGFIQFIEKVEKNKDTMEEDGFNIEKGPRPGKVLKYKNKKGVYLYIIKYSDNKNGTATVLTSSNQDIKIRECLEKFSLLYEQLQGSYIIYTDKEYERNKIKFKVVSSDNEAIQGEIQEARNLNEKYELKVNQFQEYSVSTNDIVGRMIKSQMSPYFAINGIRDYIQAVIEGGVDINATLLREIINLSDRFKGLISNFLSKKNYKARKSDRG